jgi:hypothetical protein
VRLLARLSHQLVARIDRNLAGGRVMAGDVAGRKDTEDNRK